MSTLPNLFFLSGVSLVILGVAQLLRSHRDHSSGGMASLVALALAGFAHATFATSFWTSGLAILGFFVCFVFSRSDWQTATRAATLALIFATVLTGFFRTAGNLVIFDIALPRSLFLTLILVCAGMLAFLQRPVILVLLCMMSAIFGPTFIEFAL